MSKVKDIRNFLNSRKEADSPALQVLLIMYNSQNC